jgi:enoyl-CoA hydratase/carnithine racemase
VATVTFNRPERLNAYDHQMQRDLLALVTELDHRDDIGAVILTGGGRAFMAGADITMFEQWGGQSPHDVRTSLRHQIVRPVIWQQLGKPVIAAVNGIAVGAGLATAMCADFRFASPAARFGHTAITLGILAGPAESAQTVRYLGRTLAAELLLAGRLIDAEEALRAGLLNRILDAERLLDEARTFAAGLAQLPPLGMRMAKANFAGAAQSNIDYDAEIEPFVTAMASPEARERFEQFLAGHGGYARR